MRRFLRGFVYAANGIRQGIREERNLRFHLCVAVYVFVFATFYDFGRLEYMLLCLLVGGVIALELVNSALERAVDAPEPERYVTAGIVKDMAAGAVLVFCIAAAVCGVLLFWDVAVFASILEYFNSRPWLWALFAGSLVLAYCFVFRYNTGETNKKEKKA